MTLRLNERAWKLVEDGLRQADLLGIAVRRVEGGGRVIDCGIEARGGLEAGLFLARLTVAGLADVSLAPGEVLGVPCPEVVVRSDQPVAACMASQYAGWQISTGGYFAMGSGPFRALYGAEELFGAIGCRETAEVAVGALESRSLPGPEVFRYIAERTKVEASRITLAVAPTASLAGGLQVVARSVETALHKLHAVGFDLSRIAAGFGSAPLPPPAKNDLAALGRTNDAVLYGSRVVLWARGDDDSLAQVGTRLPSSSSPDHGAPFADIFERHGRDFYQIDPLLFSPAEVVLHNLDSGRTHHFGRREPEVVRRSFYA
jgi:methenyltetrahydromethanopterin cyclohydrolase